MRIVLTHEQLVELFVDLIDIHSAGLNDQLKHEFRLIRDEFPGQDGDQNAYPQRFLAACMLADIMPREICADREPAWAALLDACGLYPRRAAMIAAVKRLGNRARTVLAQRNRPQRKGVRV